MKRVTMSFSASLAYRPEHPERTAKRSGKGMDFDVTFQTWPSRESMARSIRMQERGPVIGSQAWRPCVKLSDTEGF